MSRAVLLVAAVSLAGCPKGAPEGAALISEVRRVLTEREGRLNSYHFVAQSTEGAAVATHAFFFRSPNKMRGVVMSPVHLEWSFDGTQLVKVEPGQKKFSRFELKLPADKASMFLTSTFKPFVTEGFRTPLMPSQGVKATKVKHAQGPQAVELTFELASQMNLTYVLRWPSGDFLARKTSALGQVSELKVDEEWCEPKLLLCVPKVTTEFLDSMPQLTTRLTTIELNLDVPADDFAPLLPEGWVLENHPVVESE